MTGATQRESRLSPWWFALPAAIALVFAVAGGLVIGYQLGAAGTVAVGEVDEIETIASTGLRLTFVAGEQRTLFSTSPFVPQPQSNDGQTNLCTVTPSDGQAAPQVTDVGEQRAGRESSWSLEVNGVRWYARYQIRATDRGQLLITCDASSDVRFALGPWIDLRDYSGFGVTGFVAAGVTLVGLFAAFGIAAVLLALSLSRSRSPVD